MWLGFFQERSQATTPLDCFAKLQVGNYRLEEREPIYPNVTFKQWREEREAQQSGWLLPLYLLIRGRRSMCTWHVYRMLLSRM